MLQHARCIIQIIDRNDLRLSGAAPLTVLLLRLALLNVRAVTQHDIRQILRRVRADDLPVEAEFVRVRDHSCVVNVCVCQQDVVDVRIFHRKRCVLVDVLTLLHTAVHQDRLSASFQKMLGAGDLVIRSYKCKFHNFPSPVRPDYFRPGRQSSIYCYYTKIIRKMPPLHGRIIHLIKSVHSPERYAIRQLQRQAKADGPNIRNPGGCHTMTPAGILISFFRSFNYNLFIRTSRSAS